MPKKEKQNNNKRPSETANLRENMKTNTGSEMKYYKVF